MRIIQWYVLKHRNLEKDSHVILNRRYMFSKKALHRLFCCVTITKCSKTNLESLAYSTHLGYVVSPVLPRLPASTELLP